MKHLYRFFWDCGHQGEVEGLFIADDSEVKKAIGKHVYFGEILGKHSDVNGKFEEEDLEVISDDQNKIEWLGKILGYTVSGYNPLDYINETKEEDEE